MASWGRRRGAARSGRGQVAEQLRCAAARRASRARCRCRPRRGGGRARCRRYRSPGPTGGRGGALDVRALDEADRDALVGEAVGVGGPAAQVGLERELDRQAAARGGDPEGLDAVGGRRLLGADLQPAARRDGRQDPVERRRRTRCARGRARATSSGRSPASRRRAPRTLPPRPAPPRRARALAEQVEARREPRGGEPARGRDRVVDLLPGDVPARRPPGAVRAAGTRSHRALERAAGGEPDERAAADYGASTFSLRVTPKFPPRSAR